jgi:NADPH2:quinone reductase
LEGSGTVVASGGGLMANKAIGRRVSFIRPLTYPNYFEFGGTYQQYALADHMTIIYLDDSIPLDIGSMSFVNPLTALGLVDSIKGNKSKAAI